MPKVDVYDILNDLVLGIRHNSRVPIVDQNRQRAEVEEILHRLRKQPGIILADEVGMGKTFVALAVACSIAWQSRRGPAIIMVPANLVDKWIQDLKTFCELYLNELQPIYRDEATKEELRGPVSLRYGVARRGVELMKLLDDKPSERCHLVFLAQGSMGRQQTDKWVRLALIREALRRHGRGKAKRLIKVKGQIHRFIAELLWTVGEQKASDWGDELWQSLLHADPGDWMELYNSSVRNDRHRLTDDPVPEAVVKLLPHIDLRTLASALEEMPIRAVGGSSRVSDRINHARTVLKEVVQDLWKHVLVEARWRSPLLVMDEAHHLKNPATSLARQLQSPESERDLRTGDGALAGKFDRMLFLTATPFQLGHQELVRIMKRFGDVRWDKEAFGERATFDDQLTELDDSLTESQRTAINLQRSWERLLPEESPQNGDPDVWWQSLQHAAPDSLTPRQRALVDFYHQTRRCRSVAEKNLRPWLIRHNKGELWSDTAIERRNRFEGAAILENGNPMEGLEVPPTQLLPFFLAARSAVTPGKDLLGEALCSSYEAFRYTRDSRSAERDDLDDEQVQADLTHSAWYLSEFDVALRQCSGNVHPKIDATVSKAVDLWEAGEKVLIFAFYRYTCRALRIHISQEIERRIGILARRRFAGAGRPIDEEEFLQVLDHIQRRYFDDVKSSARQALDRALYAILSRQESDFAAAEVSKGQQERFIDIMRRFLRVPTTIVRCFPVHQYDSKEPHLAIRSMLDTEDGSGMSWRAKFEGFIDFLVDNCSSVERENYIEATENITTGKIRVHTEDIESDNGGDDVRMTLANVQEATGKTRRDQRSRLMRAFNTPFFPDILVCSQVMGEGVDLQRFCCHVIHQDLAWNPSSIEQRTGRIDRLGCKAEQIRPIHIYLPYLSGTADERQFRVMTDREQWFRIVMGQDEVAKLIPCDDHQERPSLPTAFSEGLTFRLGLTTGLE